MGCCGSKRQQMARPAGGVAAAPLGGMAPVTGAPGAHPGMVGVALVYVGMAPLTVIGAVTGRRYQFAGRGARLVVDQRDAPSLAEIAMLRRT